MFQKALVCVWLMGTSAFGQAPAFTLQGMITTDRSEPSIQLVLEDPKSRNAEVARIEPDANGNYEFRGLTSRFYRLLTVIDGKKQERRDIEILCRPGALVLKDFHYGKSESTLNLYFPAEDPDVIDVAELSGNYARDVLREYERAKENHESGAIERALQRLESVAMRAPGFYGVHARLGLIYQEVGCLGNSEEEYILASQLSPRSANPLFNLASVQIRESDLAGQKDEFLTRSLATLSRALEIRPTAAIGHCLTGAANVKKGALDDAENNFQRALEFDSSLGAARLMLADVYARRSNWTAAIEQYSRYLEDNPLSRNRSIVKEMMETAEKKL